MRMFSYKVAYDIGFAPNPFHGACTLATCKPGIRAAAAVGDLVVGVGAARNGRLGRLVYAMEVAEKLTFDAYWADPRFQLKKPDPRGSFKYRYGDNVYHHDSNGAWQQLDCRHSLESGQPNVAHLQRDTGADAVLVASTFTYWGGEGPELPTEFRDWGGADLGEPGRCYSYRSFPEEMIDAVVGWVWGLPEGYQGRPADW